MSQLKIVVVGDELDKSKRRLLAHLTQSHISINVFEATEFNLCIGKEKIKLSLYDTTGEEELNRLRALSYPSTDIFILIFDTAHPISFENVMAKWYPELSYFCPKTPIVLVSLTDNTLNPRVSNQEIQKTVKTIKPVQYFEFDFLSENNPDIFKESIQSIYKIKPLPSFFKDFKTQEIYPHVKKVVEIGKGARQQGTLFFSKPIDVLVNICDYVGNDLTTDKKSLSYFNRLILDNVRQSKPKKLVWKRALTLANKEKLKIYPDRDDDKLIDKISEKASEISEKAENLLNNFKRLFK